MAESKILWIDLQPTLHCLNKRVAQLLSRSFVVQRWSFQHDLDESCTVDTVLDLLRSSLEEAAEPVHLVGHGISGTVACLFAEKYPALVKSLTMLSVDTLSANHWSSHYLEMRSKLSCSRKTILTHLSTFLFPRSNQRANDAFPCLLAKCLDTDFIYGSIVNQGSIDNLKVPNIPVLVINGDSDCVADEKSRERWSRSLKSGDRFFCMEKGCHFFQFNQARQAANAIISFIQMVPEPWSNRVSVNDFMSLARGRG